MRSERAFATALVLATVLTGCSALSPVDAERCREWAPEVEPPGQPRTAPEGWPDPPEGDVLCGSSYTGDDVSGIEVVIAVTDRPLDEVLDHYEAAMPASLPVERWGEGEDARLWGHVPGLLYAVEPSGERRYALVFQTLANA